MSAYHSIYLGPYAKCMISKKQSTETVRVCDNTICSVKSRFFSSAFCNRCGSKLIDKEIPVEVQVQNWAEISELLEERLCCGMENFGGEFHVWRSNRHCDFGISVDYAEFPILEPVSPSVISNEIGKFNRMFEKELDILRQQYGAENVSIGWGLVGYSS